MKVSRVVRAAALVMMGALVAAPASGASSRSTTRWVDDDGRAGPTSCGGSRSAARKVHTAVDRSDLNDVVIVCPGVYTEEIGIVGSTRAGMTLRAYTKGTAVIRVPKSVTFGPPIWVEHVNGVTVQGLTFEFPSSGCDTHSGDLQGMWVQDADGTRIQGNRFRTRGADTQGPCGYEDGIRVISSKGVRVTNNVFRDFKSDGISFEAGTTGLIQGNLVQFYHRLSTSTDDGDQGIRIEHARAEVAENRVRSYPDPARLHLELGIVIQHGSGVSDVHDNEVSYVQTGIGVIGSRAKVRSNDLYGVGVGYGTFVLSGSGTEVLSNRLQAFDIGIQVDAAGTTLRHNDARGNVTLGCYDTTTGSGSAGTANLWSSSNTGSPASAPDGICRVP